MLASKSPTQAPTHQPEKPESGQSSLLVAGVAGGLVFFAVLAATIIVKKRRAMPRALSKLGTVTQPGVGDERHLSISVEEGSFENPMKTSSPPQNQMRTVA